MWFWNKKRNLLQHIQMALQIINWTYKGNDFCLINKTHAVKIQRWNLWLYQSVSATSEQKQFKSQQEITISYPIYRTATCQAQGCLVDIKVITVTQLSDLFSLPTFTYTTISFFFCLKQMMVFKILKYFWHSFLVILQIHVVCIQKCFSKSLDWAGKYLLIATNNN